MKRCKPGEHEWRLFRRLAFHAWGRICLACSLEQTEVLS